MEKAWLLDQRDTAKLKRFGELGDEALLGIYRDTGDPEVIGVLYTRYTHLVFGNCYRYLGREEVARDAVMEIFEKLFDTLKEDEIRHFSSWLYQVSRNYCLMKLRKTGTEAKHLRILKAEKEGEIMESGLVMHLKEEELEIDKDRLKAAMKKLKKAQRTCLELMYMEDMSYKDIAERTGYSLRSVKSHIQNGKRKLRILLEHTARMIIISILWLF